MSKSQAQVDFPGVPAAAARRALVAGIAALFGAVNLLPGAAMAADAAPKVASLSAQQIVDRNIAARGGAAAWKAVQSMVWSGKMDAGNADSAARSAKYARLSQAPIKKADAVAISKAGEAPEQAAKQVQLPFVLDMKRPGMSRLELEFASKTAIQVYDGKSGWKMRPFLNRTDWEPFTPEELKASAGKWDLTGPLFDAAAKGIKVDADGVEAVEGQPAYRLKLTYKDGATQHIWIDARTFLDVKIEGIVKRMDGKMRHTYIAQRDFRQVQGVLVPYVLETTVEGFPDVHKMLIEKVALNPVLTDDLFTRPRAAGGA